MAHTNQPYSTRHLSYVLDDDRVWPGSHCHLPTHFTISLRQNITLHDPYKRSKNLYLDPMVLAVAICKRPRCYSSIQLKQTRELDLISLQSPRLWRNNENCGGDLWPTKVILPAWIRDSSEKRDRADWSLINEVCLGTFGWEPTQIQWRCTKIIIAFYLTVRMTRIEESMILWCDGMDCYYHFHRTIKIEIASQNPAPSHSNKPEKLILVRYMGMISHVLFFLFLTQRYLGMGGDTWLHKVLQGTETWARLDT